LNAEIKIGVLNKLRIDRDSDHGLYLVTNDDLEDVLLPRAYVTDEMQLDDEIEVFIYTDSEDRIIATTKRPYAMLGEFGLFRVLDATPIGAFVNWGLPKDLFVPKSVQKQPYEVGRSYILRVAYDEETDRLFGDSRVGRYLTHDVKLMSEIKVADIFVIAKTPLGFKVIANNQFEGMIYHNEIFEEINIGDRKKAYVKNLRDDGKFDLSLQPIGDDKDALIKEKILTLLQKDKTLPYNYKSDAQDIKKVFGLSKKNFKKALTKLKDDGVITIDETGIRLS
jgi:predicted RNA-binding protein (virulence factor B family)